MMNFNTTLRALTGATLLLIAACAPAVPTEEPPLAGARIGAPLALTDQDGKQRREADFAGQYRLVYFGYTFCPDVCPVDLNWLMHGLKQYEAAHPDAAARIQPIFITVDPARDTPAVLKTYVRQFHPRLIGLTGDQAAIDAVTSGFAVTATRQPGATPGSYLMAHSQLTFLMAPDGKPLALIPTDDIRTPDVNEGAPSLVAAELARWVR